MGTRTSSANIPTPRPHANANRAKSNGRTAGNALDGVIFCLHTGRSAAAPFFVLWRVAVLFCFSMSRAIVAITLSLLLSFGSALEASTHSSAQKRKTKKPASPPCQTGCKPEISQPQVTADTPEDEAAQKELADLARELHGPSKDAYQKLSAFAAKNTTNVWGARAALALGYDDYSKNRAGQGLGWLLKAQNDALLREICFVLDRPSAAHAWAKRRGV